MTDTESEMVCQHCKLACWLLETPCDNQPNGAEETEHTRMKAKSSQDDTDSAEAFFYRFLLLDDMKQKQKEEREIRPQSIQIRPDDLEIETKFKPRKTRPVTPSTRNTEAGSRGQPSCHRCGEAVYRAEARSALGKTFHAFCFTCLACNRFLDTMNITDGTDGEVYCNNCYKTRFLKDVNRPLGAAKTTSILAGEGDNDRCPRCFGKVFEAEKALSSHGIYHRACFRCAELECGKQLDSTSYCDSETGLIFCKTCYSKIHGPRGFGFGASPTLVSGPIYAEENSRASTSTSREKSTSTVSFSMTASPRCPKCNAAVYAPERVFVGRKVWHKACLTCQTCSRSLDASLLNEVEDGARVFCPKCYKNNGKPTQKQKV